MVNIFEKKQKDSVVVLGLGYRGKGVEGGGVK
jgi:hypothetical protein